MIDTMYDEVGIGLAAPQVGVSLRLLVVGDEEGRGAQVLVESRHHEQGGTVTAEEGCLSLPGFFAPVTRAQWVKLEAQDLDGQADRRSPPAACARVCSSTRSTTSTACCSSTALDAVTRDRMKRRIKKDGFTEDPSAHRAFAL